MFLYSCLFILLCVACSLRKSNFTATLHGSLEVQVAQSVGKSFDDKPIREMLSKLFKGKEKPTFELPKTIENDLYGRNFAPEKECTLKFPDKDTECQVRVNVVTLENCLTKKTKEEAEAPCYRCTSLALTTNSKGLVENEGARTRLAGTFLSENNAATSVEIPVINQPKINEKGLEISQHLIFKQTGTDSYHDLGLAYVTEVKDGEEKVKKLVFGINEKGTYGKDFFTVGSRVKAKEKLYAKKQMVVLAETAGTVMKEVKEIQKGKIVKKVDVKFDGRTNLFRVPSYLITGAVEDDPLKDDYERFRNLLQLITEKGKTKKSNGMTYYEFDFIKSYMRS